MHNNVHIKHVEPALKVKPAEQLSVMLGDDTVCTQGYNKLHQQSIKQSAILPSSAATDDVAI